MVSLINKQLLLTAYAYLFIMEQMKAQQGSEAIQLGSINPGSECSRQQLLKGEAWKNKLRHIKAMPQEAIVKGVDQATATLLLNKIMEQEQGGAPISSLEAFKQAAVDAVKGCNKKSFGITGKAIPRSWVVNLVGQMHLTAKDFPAPKQQQQTKAAATAEVAKAFNQEAAELLNKALEGIRKKYGGKLADPIIATEKEKAEDLRKAKVTELKAFAKKKDIVLHDKKLLTQEAGFRVMRSDGSGPAAHAEYFLRSVPSGYGHDRVPLEIAVSVVVDSSPTLWYWVEERRGNERVDLAVTIFTMDAPTAIQTHANRQQPQGHPTVPETMQYPSDKDVLQQIGDILESPQDPKQGGEEEKKIRDLRQKAVKPAGRMSGDEFDKAVVRGAVEGARSTQPTTPMDKARFEDICNKFKLNPFELWAYYAKIVDAGVRPQRATAAEKKANVARLVEVLEGDATLRGWAATNQASLQSKAMLEFTEKQFNDDFRKWFFCDNTSFGKIQRALFP